MSGYPKWTTADRAALALLPLVAGTAVFVVAVQFFGFAAAPALDTSAWTLQAADTNAALVVRDAQARLLYAASAMLMVFGQLASAVVGAHIIWAATHEDRRARAIVAAVVIVLTLGGLVSADTQLLGVDGGSAAALADALSHHTQLDLRSIWLRMEYASKPEMAILGAALVAILLPGWDRRCEDDQIRDRELARRYELLHLHLTVSGIALGLTVLHNLARDRWLSIYVADEALAAQIISYASTAALAVGLVYTVNLASTVGSSYLLLRSRALSLARASEGCEPGSEKDWMLERGHHLGRVSSLVSVAAPTLASAIGFIDQVF
jgi:hypothetical protein